MLRRGRHGERRVAVRLRVIALSARTLEVECRARHAYPLEDALRHRAFVTSPERSIFEVGAVVRTAQTRPHDPRDATLLSSRNGS
jgi:hypothetical protein